MINVAIDLSEAKEFFKRQGDEGRQKFSALVGWARIACEQIIEGILQAELSVFLEKEQEEGRRGQRNGYRLRQLLVTGLGRLLFRVPRDRGGKFRSELLPWRSRRTAELEALAAEMFLSGSSTRDVSRILERHFSARFDSKEISRMVEASCADLDQWHRRRITEKYWCIYLDGSYFKVRRGGKVERIPFLAITGVRVSDNKMEVLGIELGDKENKSMWEKVFQDLIARGMDPQVVEVGVMDGLPGLEAAFKAAFSNARTQRCQVHAKRNALKRISKKDREPFRKDLDRVFYAPNEAVARKTFTELKARWERTYPSGVYVIEKDLDSLLRFYQWEEKFWPSLRTTNPIERLNKEFKRRTKAMEVTGGERNTYRLLSYVALTMNLTWRKYALSTPRYFYTLKAA